jgi:hypothetical protein
MTYQCIHSPLFGNLSRCNGAPTDGRDQKKQLLTPSMDQLVSPNLT